MKSNPRAIAIAFCLILLLPACAQAYYSPEQGRWISRDPIEEQGGMNVQAFVKNEPTDRVDRLGKEIIPPPSPEGPCEAFERWYQDAKRNLKWLKALPSCPCSLTLHCTVGNKFEALNPDPKIWKDPSDKGPGVHTGATWNMRSKPTSDGAAQQCSYDANGRLITWGPGAGTADRYSSFFNHVADDYTPAMWAIQCDRLRKNESCIRQYLEVRPINNGNNCARNPPQ